MKRSLLATLLFALSLTAGAQEGDFTFRTVSTLTPDLKTGVFRLHMEAQQPTEVFYELVGPDSVTVADAVFSFHGPINTLADTIRNVRPWSPESPDFYTLRLTVNGKVSSYPVSFFREEKGLFNGREVHYKGVRLHGGAQLPAAEFSRMRAAGINALQDSTLTREQCHALGFYRADGKDFPAWEAVRADSLLLPLKRAFQPIAITLEDAEKGLCTLHNLHDFIDLSGFTLHYWVERDGKRPFWYRRRELRFQTPAQQQERFLVKLPRMRCKGEYRLCFELRKGTEVVAQEDFLLKDTTPQEKRIVKGKLLYTEGDTQIVVRGRRCEWVLDKVNGELRSWVVRGRPLLAPGTALVLGQEKPQQTYARKGPGETVYVYLKGAHNLRLTFYPDGAFKVEGAPSCVSFTPAEDTVRYFGRQPGAYKHYWESCTEGLQTETDWLCSGSITAVADTPFTFRIRARKTWLSVNGSLVLTPQKTKRNYYE